MYINFLSRTPLVTHTPFSTIFFRTFHTAKIMKYPRENSGFKELFTLAKGKPKAFTGVAVFSGSIYALHIFSKIKTLDKKIEYKKTELAIIHARIEEKKIDYAKNNNSTIPEKSDVKLESPYEKDNFSLIEYALALIEELF